MKKGKKLYALILSVVFSIMILPNTINASEIFTPYDSYPQLNFEGDALASSTWGGEIELKFVKNDETLTAYEGSGALYVNSDGGQFSVWGGPATGEGNMPKAGDKVSGYFYYKRLSADGDWKLPRVRIYSESVGNTPDGWLAVTKDIDSTNNNIAPIGEWVKIELEPTSRLVTADDIGHMGFNITCDGTGNEFMIDNIVFGSVTEVIDTPPTADVSTNVVPLIEEYAGSSMNGDFEVGSATLGNQYWGTYPDGMLSLITDGTVTEAKTVYSGKNMVSINRDGVAWNIFDFASNSNDTLPRAGDTAGGSYMLYVPENADLTKGVPYVNFGYQQNGADIMTATGADFDKTKLKKGAWNKIPILPNGTEIVSGVTNAVIFVMAQNIDTNVTYYVDNIRVGKIKEGLFLSDASALVDENGSVITNPDSYNSVNANIVIQNSTASYFNNASAIVGAYENGVLVSAKVKNINIAPKSDSGISVTEVLVNDLNISNIDKDKLRIKAFVFESLSSLKPVTNAKTLYTKTKRIAPNNENIRYIGRWTGDENSYRSAFVRPYLKTSFTGTSVKIKLERSCGLVVTVDGKTTTMNSANGLVTLGEDLPEGTHSLRVASLQYTDVIDYSGLYIDNDASLLPPQTEDTHIEFIGDSITAWDNGYSWQVGEALGVEHSRIAWPGIALVDGYGYTGLNPLLGISSAYFKFGLAGVQDVTYPASDWDFSKAHYSPDIIVINIGTNDCESIWAIPSFLENFTNTYSSLIDSLRAKFPSAEIFALRAVSMPRSNVNDAVYNMITAKIASDAKLHYIDTTNWNVSILPDNIHPDANGHTTITNNLVNILKPYINGADSPGETPAPPAEDDDETINISPYDCWNNLKFENGGNVPQNSDKWMAVEGDMEFTNSSDMAYSGNGAMLLNGQGSTSLWGTRVAGTTNPSVGDKVSGYFMIKLLKKATALPVVKMTKFDDHSVIFCKTKSMTASEIEALPVGEWIKIELEPTNVTYYEGDSVGATSGFVIETVSGVNCLIDDVTFGKVIE